MLNMATTLPKPLGVTHYVPTVILLISQPEDQRVALVNSYGRAVRSLDRGTISRSRLKGRIECGTPIVRTFISLDACQANSGTELSPFR